MKTTSKIFTILIMFATQALAAGEGILVKTIELDLNADGNVDQAKLIYYRSEKAEPIRSYMADEDVDDLRLDDCDRIKVEITLLNKDRVKISERKIWDAPNTFAFPLGVRSERASVGGPRNSIVLVEHYPVNMVTRYRSYRKLDTKDKNYRTSPEFFEGFFSNNGDATFTFSNFPPPIEQPAIE